MSDPYVVSGSSSCGAVDHDLQHVKMKVSVLDVEGGVKAEFLNGLQTDREDSK